jgi:hypothetical protein
MKRLISLSALLFIAAACCFGEWTWSTTESIASANGTYKAQLTLRPTGTTELEVSRPSNEQELWTRNIDWPKDCFGMLSNDGKVFVVVNDNYSEEQYLVTVYTADKQAGYSVNEIKISREFLITRDNKHTWIDLDEKHISFVYDASGSARYLDLVVYSGKTLEIQL